MVAVREIMHGITVVPSIMAVYEVAQIMERKNIGSVLVESDGDICGILTERDLLKKIVARASDPLRVRASEIMTQVMYTIDHEDDLMKASELFAKHGIRRLPVTKEGKIVGMVSARAVAQAMPYALCSRLRSVRTIERNHYPEF